MSFPAAAAAGAGAGRPVPSSPLNPSTANSISTVLEAVNVRAIVLRCLGEEMVGLSSVCKAWKGMLKDQSAWRQLAIARPGSETAFALAASSPAGAPPSAAKAADAAQLPWRDLALSRYGAPHAKSLFASQEPIPRTPELQVLHVAVQGDHVFKAHVSLYTRGGRMVPGVPYEFGTVIFQTPLKKSPGQKELMYTLPQIHPVNSIECVGASESVVVCCEGARTSSPRGMPHYEYYQSRRIHFWRRGAPQNVLRSLDKPVAAAAHLALNDTHLFVARNAQYHPGTIGNGVDVYDIETGTALIENPTQPGQPVMEVTKRVVSRDQHTFFSLHSNEETSFFMYSHARNQKPKNTVRLWDLRAPQQSTREFLFEGFDDVRCSALCVSPFHSSHLYTASTTQFGNGAVVRLWDVGSGKCVKAKAPKGGTLRGGNRIDAMAMGNGLLYTGSNYGEIRAWNSNLTCIGKRSLPSEESSKDTTTGVIYMHATHDSLSVLSTQYADRGVPVYQMNRFWHYETPKTTAAPLVTTPVKNADGKEPK